MRGRLSDLVLTYDGVATVIAGGQVLRMNAKGEVVKLDEGAITPGSLAGTENGTHLYWIKDGAARSATFADPPDQELAGSASCRSPTAASPPSSRPGP